MTDVLAFSVFGVEWQFIKPFIVIGLAFGGVYALSGVGLVVLYRATGVLNLAFGAIGAAGALIAYWLINHTSCPQWLAFAVCVAFGGVVNLLYGMVFGPAFARRDPLVKMMGTLGLALILLGIMAWMAPVGGAFARFLPLPSTQHRYEILETTVNLTQLISLGLAIVITAAVSVFLRVTKLGTAMRALANDREITATLGVPVRRVEAAAWFGSGLACGAAGLILPDLLTSLDYSALTFLVISSLAAALIGRLQSLWATMFGGLAVGLAQSVLSPYASLSAYRSAAPFVLAIAALLYLSRRRVVTISRATTLWRRRHPAKAPRRRAQRRRSNGERSPAAPVRSFWSPSQSASCRRSWARTGLRPSRAWPSTRSQLSASASSTAASG